MRRPSSVPAPHHSILRPAATARPAGVACKLLAHSQGSWKAAPFPPHPGAPAPRLQDASDNLLVGQIPSGPAAGPAAAGLATTGPAPATGGQARNATPLGRRLQQQPPGAAAAGQQQPSGPWALQRLSYLGGWLSAKR